MWLVLDYICDGVYILDIAVRLRTGTGKYESRLKFLLLHKNYMIVILTNTLAKKNIIKDILVCAFLLCILRFLGSRLDGERRAASERNLRPNITV